MAHRWPAAIGAAALVLTACTSGPAATPSAPSTSPSTTVPSAASPTPDATTTTAAVAPLDLSLLVFNVEYGGTKATDAVIKDVGADVVSVLESYARLPTMARNAGYPYYDYGLQILSKFPILETSQADGRYALIEVRPGEAVALVNTHLDYVKYGPTRLARGVPVARVLADENEVRTSSIDKLLPSVRDLLAEDYPVLLTGDLNEPSHLDWTAASASSHGGFGPIAWPVSEAIIGTGLRDVYRSAHPDPVTDPGDTWGGVAGRDAKQPSARIDFAYAGGPVEVVSSEVVGEQGGPGVDRGYPKWTSDHRAVWSTLRVTPAPVPTTVALSTRMATVGDTVTVTYWAPEGTAAGVLAVTGPSSASYPVTGTAGTRQVPTSGLAPGAYQVVLTDGQGSEIARNSLYLRPPDASVRLTTDAASYAVGAPITVSWQDGPANRWDWIGVYAAGAADPATDDYLLWGYTGGHDAGALPPSTEGSFVLGRDQLGKPWPLPPGRYVVHYLLSDQYQSAGTARFTVR